MVPWLWQLNLSFLGVSVDSVFVSVSVYIVHDQYDPGQAKEWRTGPIQPSLVNPSQPLSNVLFTVMPYEK